MTWRLRRAGEADAAALSLLASAAFLDTYASVLDGADLVAHCLKHNGTDAFASWASDPATTMVLAEHEPGHAPIGYTVLTAPDFPFALRPDDIELRRIYTLSQFHGRGLGHALMTRALADAAERGFGRVLLGVWDENRRARAFYERQGFLEIGSRRFRVGAVMHVDPVYAKAV